MSSSTTNVCCNCKTCFVLSSFCCSSCVKKASSAKFCCWFDVSATLFFAEFVSIELAISATLWSTFFSFFLDLFLNKPNPLFSSGSSTARPFKLIFICSCSGIFWWFTLFWISACSSLSFLASFLCFIISILLASISSYLCCLSSSLLSLFSSCFSNQFSTTLLIICEISIPKTNANSIIATPMLTATAPKLPNNLTSGTAAKVPIAPPPLLLFPNT